MSRLAIIDIGSTSVGGAIIELPAKAPTNSTFCDRLINPVRNEAPFSNNVDLARYLEAINGALKKTLDDLSRGGQGIPSEIVCFLAAPFYASRTQVIYRSEPKKLTVTPKLVTNLVTEEIDRFKSATPQLFKAGTAGGHQVVDSEVMRLALDGYVLNNPYHQSTENLAVTHYLSIASSPILEKLRQTISTTWHRPATQFHSFSFAFYRALGVTDPGKQNLLVLDIGGEITELTLIWQGLLWQTISFPLGRNWLIRQVAETLGTTPAEALSSLRLYFRKEQHPLAAEKLKAALAHAQTEWLETFRQALEKILDHCLLPENIFALADPWLRPVFIDWLKGEQFENLTIGNKKFTVNVAPEEIFKHYCSHSTTAVHDFNLLVEMIFCATINNK